MAIRMNSSRYTSTKKIFCLNGGFGAAVGQGDELTVVPAVAEGLNDDGYLYRNTDGRPPGAFERRGVAIFSPFDTSRGHCNRSTEAQGSQRVVGWGRGAWDRPRPSIWLQQELVASGLSTSTRWI